MMPGILIGTANAVGKKVDIAYIDYGSLVSQTGILANIKLPGKFKPQAYPDGMFGFDFSRVNPDPLGVGIDASTIQEVWEGLEKEGFPLEEVSQGLIVCDITASIRGVPSKTPGQVHHYYPIIPSFAEVVELVGHVGEIRAFHTGQCNGFETRLAELRKNLKGVFRRKALDKVSLTEYVRVVNEAGISILLKKANSMSLSSF